MRPEGHGGIVLGHGSGQVPILDRLEHVRVAVHRRRSSPCPVLLASETAVAAPMPAVESVPTKAARSGLRVMISLATLIAVADVGFGVTYLHDLDPREGLEGVSESCLAVIEHLRARDAQDGNLALLAQWTAPDCVPPTKPRVVLMGADKGDPFGIREVTQDGDDRDPGRRWPCLSPASGTDHTPKTQIPFRVLGDRLVERRHLRSSRRTRPGRHTWP